MMYIPFDYVNLSDTDNLTFRIETSILDEIKAVVKEEFLDNHTQAIRKAIRFYLEYRNIPNFELIKLKRHYDGQRDPD